MPLLGRHRCSATLLALALIVPLIGACGSSGAPATPTPRIVVVPTATPLPLSTSPVDEARFLAQATRYYQGVLAGPNGIIANLKADLADPARSQTCPLIDNLAALRAQNQSFFPDAALPARFASVQLALLGAISNLGQACRDQQNALRNTASAPVATRTALGEALSGVYAQRITETAQAITDWTEALGLPTPGF